jgi:ABC-type oligopeptide transport system substrate-binding subunit
LVDNGYAAKESTVDKPKLDCTKLGDIRLTFPSNAVNHRRFQFLASNLLTAFNCPVLLEPVDPSNYAVLLKDSKTAPQISFQPWLGDYAHPQDWLSLYWTCNAFADRYGYCNKDFDALVLKADQEPDSTKSIQLYQQAEDLLLKDVPSIFGTYSENISLVKPYVSGPKDHTGTADLGWPGESGPVWTYRIDLTHVPNNYPTR